jgi:hypothetical protein
MTTKHTPAPWSLDLGIRNAAILDTKGNEIALVEVGIHDEETELELQANAKLIAAAPDMYIELEKCAKLLRSYQIHHLQKGDREKADRNRRRAENCEKVLAKARGE